MNRSELEKILASFRSLEQAFDYFEIDFDSRFINENRTAVMKRFNGYWLLDKPEDWFAARRALRNAYCKVQRSLLPKGGRTACRGCMSCQRR